MEDSLEIMKAEDIDLEFFDSGNIPYRWTSETADQHRHLNIQSSSNTSLTNTQSTRAKRVISYSATNSPATRARLNLSSNNPFLTEQDSIPNGANNSVEYAHLFKRHKSSVDHSKESCESRNDSSNFKHQHSVPDYTSESSRQCHDQSTEERKISNENDAVPKIKPRSMSERKEVETSKHDPKECPPNSYASKQHGPRVFGKNFKYMKGYIKSVSTKENEPANEQKAVTTPPILIEKTEFVRSNGHRLKEQLSTREYGDLSADEDEIHKKYLKLKQELKSSAKKIQQLKEINSMALQRKGELQREALEAYKSISKLEISNNSSKTKEKEMALEIRLAKQRIGEAEREASHAIGRASKFERELKQAETKRQRYYEELNVAEKRVNTLEIEMSEAKANCRLEAEQKSHLNQALQEKEAELSILNERHKSLEDAYEKKEQLYAFELEKGHVVAKERAKYEAQIEELTKANAFLRDELQNLQTRYDNTQRALEQCAGRVKEQKCKFDSLILSRLDMERELREMHNETSQERSEKLRYSNECKELLGKLTESKNSLNSCRLECDELQKENRHLKDKVLYLDLYKKMVDEKAKERDCSKAVGSHFRSNANKLVKTANSSDVTFVDSCHNAKNQTDSDFAKIMTKLGRLKREHDVIHKSLKLTHTGHPQEQVSFNESESHVHTPTSSKEHKETIVKDQSITFQLPGQEIIYQEDEISSRIEDDRLPLSCQDDSYYDLDSKTDDSCLSPVELLMDLDDRTTIYPSFVTGMQDSLNNEEQKETSYSDLLHADNKDIAAALL